MSFQELCNKYKKEVCPYCINTNKEDCNICKTLDGVKCCGYKKDKSKININKLILYWQKW